MASPEQIAQRHLDEVDARRQTSPEPLALLPTVLVQACAAVLPVDGAGLNMGAGLQIPMSANNPAVTAAERLQATLGDGPCLAAARSGKPVTADFETMRERWPVYSSELEERSDFRSTCSTPLDLPWSSGRIVLDLYSTDPSAAPFTDVDALHRGVVEPLTARLAGYVDDGLGSAEPARGPAEQRMEVWTAIGRVMSALEIGADEALDVLRAAAYRSGQELDGLAHRLNDETVDVEGLLR